MQKRTKLFKIFVTDGRKKDTAHNNVVISCDPDFYPGTLPIEPLDLISHCEIHYYQNFICVEGGARAVRSSVCLLPMLL